MKNITIILIIALLAATVSAYKFLGPKWPGTNPVITYYLHEEGSQDVTDEWEYLHRSFEVWTEVEGTVIKCEYKGMTDLRKTDDDKINTVRWEEGSGWPHGSNTIGVCYYWKYGGTLTDFDIIYNGRDFQWSTTGEAGKMDVGHIATHETGHALGLGHSGVREAVMYAYASAGDISHRELHTDDSLAIVNLYPHTPSTNNPPEITSDPVTEAISGMKYEYQVEAEDPDGDDITYSLITKPLNMNISAEGIITWYPKFLDIGSHQVVVQAADGMGANDRQTFSVNVTDLVVYTEDQAVNTGETFYCPVKVTPMDGYDIVAGNIEVSWNTSELSVDGVDTVGSVIAGASMAINFTSGSLKLAFAGPVPFSGEGILFRLETAVPEGQCGKDLKFTIGKAFFNDGDPAALTREGIISTECPPSPDYSVDGKIQYEANNEGVGGVALRMTRDNGDLLGEVISGSDGAYSFDALPMTQANPYYLAAAKDSGDIQNAISAYDASLILRNIVDLIELNDYPSQEKVSDVNGNDMLTAYDAALILRFLVGYDDATRIGHWEMMPETTVISNLTEPRHNVIIKTCLYGDVSGNWKQAADPAAKRFPGTVSGLILPDYESQTLENRAGESVEIFKTMLSAENAYDIYSGELEMQIDGDKFEVYSIRPAVLLNGFTSAHNVVGNRLKIAFAGTEPFSGTGDLIEVSLVAKGSAIVDDANMLSEITSARFNELSEGSISIERRRGSAAEKPEITGITSIYPNPFNPLVNIDYSLLDKSEVTAAVYSISGKLLRSLEQGIVEPGKYHIAWNGRDMAGKKLASGVYVLRFEAGQYAKALKLYMVK